MMVVKSKQGVQGVKERKNGIGRWNETLDSFLLLFLFSLILFQSSLLLLWMAEQGKKVCCMRRRHQKCRPKVGMVRAGARTFLKAKILLVPLQFDNIDADNNFSESTNVISVFHVVPFRFDNVYADS